MHSVLCLRMAACCLVVLCLCGTQPTPPPEPLVICEGTSSVTIRSNSQRFGFFSDKLYSDYSSTLDTLTSLFGTKPAYILWFQQIDDPFPLTVVSSNAGRAIGTVISLNLMSLHYDSLRNDTLLREIAQGAWDSTLAVFARQAKQAAVPVYVRFGYEMNGNWFPWGENPAEFLSAWHHAHRVFTQEKADNVKWVFAPGVLWDTMRAWISCQNNFKEKQKACCITFTYQRVAKVLTKPLARSFVLLRENIPRQPNALKKTVSIS